MAEWRQSKPTQVLSPIVAGVLVLATGAGACRQGRSGSSRVPPTSLDRAFSLAGAKAQPGGAAGAGATGPASPSGASGLETMAAARKLIRTGHLSLEVVSFSEAQQRAALLATSLGGYLADSQSTRSEQGKVRGSLTLRVPSERFDALLEGVKSLGTVQAENVSTQDVTKAYTDLETRLRVKRTTAERLQLILNTRTARLSDVLEVERELARVTEEIETLEGERRFYDQQVALSTITADLAEPQPLVRAGFLDPIRTALGQALELLGGSVAVLLSLLVLALPWAIAVAGLFWVVRRLRRRGVARPPA